MKGFDGCLTYPHFTPGSGAEWFYSKLEEMLRASLRPQPLAKSVTAGWFTAHHQTYGCLSSPKPERIMGNRAIAFDALQPPNPPPLLSADTPFSNL